MPEGAVAYTAMGTVTSIVDCGDNTSQNMTTTAASRHDQSTGNAAIVSANNLWSNSPTAMWETKVIGTTYL